MQAESLGAVVYGDLDQLGGRIDADELGSEKRRRFAQQPRGGIGGEAREVEVLLEELVEVAHHLPVGGQLLGGRAPDRVRHATDELVEERYAAASTPEALASMAALGMSLSGGV